MKQRFRKVLSLFLSLSLLCSLGLSAAASEALGENLTAVDTLLHRETQLSTNVFWSTAYSDLRTENLITYTPSEEVTPIVTCGETLTERSTVSAAARELEAQGRRVVAGINGDFYNMGSGVPVGIVISRGELLSSDGGCYGIGFREDGTALLGRPGLKISVDLGYELEDGSGTVVRQLGGVNKARESKGGIFLYTYDFNDRHTTGNTMDGVDVICTVQEGRLAVGETLTAVVEEVVETSSATPVEPEQVVLSVNLQSGDYYVEALRNLPTGAEISVSVAAADEAWEDVDYAVGALYSLVEQGSVASGLPSGANPRTAVGQRSDGTLVFYTIDGRRSGHSIGATLSQMAQRMIELDCETALCLDGGGSTTLSVTRPDRLEAGIVNRPSEGSERAVSNHVFLVADSEPSGRLSHFYVQADSQYVLAGSRVNISACAVDTNFIPMEEDYRLEADGGVLDGNILITPYEGGEITVTAGNRRGTGSTTVYAVEEPDSLTIRGSGGEALSALSTAPGSVTRLTAAATYLHKPLKADPEAFTWSVEGEIGEIDETGAFTAAAPGSGVVTVSAGGRSASLPVTVTNLAFQTVEDFEEEPTVFSGGYGTGLDYSRSRIAETVQRGRASGRLDYTLEEEYGCAAEWRFAAQCPEIAFPYTCVNLWVYGDGSGNTLSLLYMDGFGDVMALPAAVMDFTGWKQVSAALPQRSIGILGLRIDAGEAVYTYDEDGTEHVSYPDTKRTGTVYIDQLTAAPDGEADNTVPDVTLQVSGGTLTGTARDEADGVLPRSAVSVTLDGKPLDFSYNGKTGEISAVLPAADNGIHRVTITARDHSGNVGRASWDVPAGEDCEPAFSDTVGHWTAPYADYLYAAGITGGYADGTFRPGQEVSRVQFAVMLYRALGLDGSEYDHVELPFADADKIPDYALSAVRTLYGEGVIGGSMGKDGKSYFNPDSSLTRAQAAAIIGRTQEKGYASAGLTFSDAAQIPSYAYGYIQTMAAQGILGGYGDGTFRPGSKVTRGHMAKILYNLM